jgi:hypothetical protein
VLARHDAGPRRAVIDEHELPQKRPDRSTAYPRRLWSPGRFTVAYLGEVPVGLTIVEMSGEVEVTYSNEGYVRKSDCQAPNRRRSPLDAHGIPSKLDLPADACFFRRIVRTRAGVGRSGGVRRAEVRVRRCRVASGPARREGSGIDPRPARSAAESEGGRGWKVRITAAWFSAGELTSMRIRRCAPGSDGWARVQGLPPAKSGGLSVCVT